MSKLSYDQPPSHIIVCNDKASSIDLRSFRSYGYSGATISKFSAPRIIHLEKVKVAVVFLDYFNSRLGSLWWAEHMSVGAAVEGSVREC
jgi:hypothetical protein